jgi:hypothetical protein
MLARSRHQLAGQGRRSSPTRCLHANAHVARAQLRWSAITLLSPMKRDTIPGPDTSQWRCATGDRQKLKEPPRSGQPHPATVETLPLSLQID